jgi:hypothetical protein
LIYDNDIASRETAAIVCAALAQAQVSFALWQWEEGERNDLFEFVETLDAALPPSNLRELLQKRFAAGRYNESTAASPLNGQSVVNTVELLNTLTLNGKLCFPLPPPLYTAQQLNSSTAHTRAREREAELRAIAHRFAMTQPKTGHKQAFMLARAIKPLNLSLSQIREVHRVWFEQSRLMLPKEANETQSWNKFLDQLRRVRFTDTGLSNAIERARQAKLPAIPALAHNEQALKLAALCRELQRERGDGPFLCPVNVTQKYFELRSPKEANLLLQVLEAAKVLECVRRGERHKPGIKGKSTLWRYKLPLDE